jgi:hypothetical protein
MGASTSWNPQGLSRPVMGLLYLYFFQIKFPDPLQRDSAHLREAVTRPDGLEMLGDLWTCLTLYRYHSAQQIRTICLQYRPVCSQFTAYHWFLWLCMYCSDIKLMQRTKSLELLPTKFGLDKWIAA